MSSRKPDNIKAYHSIVGRYVAGYGHAHREDRPAGWRRICRDHEKEFPRIHDCVPGTFNVKIRSPEDWYLPADKALRALARRRGRGDEKRYKDGNYISPLAVVTRINGIELRAWFYAGSQRHKRNRIIELVSTYRIVDLIGVEKEDEVRLTVLELWLPEDGMPGPPTGTFEAR